MSTAVEYRRGAVRTGDTLHAGWALVHDRYAFFLFSTLVALLIGSAAPFQLLAGPAMCGIQLCYLERADGREPTWEELLKGLDYFLPGFVATFLTGVALLVAALPFFVVIGVGLYIQLNAHYEGMSPPFDPMLLTAGALAAFGLQFIVQVNILFFFMFAYVLIVDRQLNGFRALVVSTRAVWANLGGLVGVFMLLSAILLLPVAIPAVVGFTVSWILALVAALAMALFVTVVTLPILFGAITVAYRCIFPAGQALQE